MMKRLTAIFLVQTALLFLTDNLYAQNSRSSHSINSNWAFYKGELQLPVNPGSVAWDTVSIPHSWNSEDVMDDTKGYYRGPAWYLKRISVSESRQDKRAYLEFKGANQKTDVYVNGHRAGSHVGGYTAFTVDISEFLRYGEENEILIKVNNRFNPDIPTLTADFTFFGGIYRDLFLTFTGAVHFSMDSYGSSGVKVITPKVSAAEADIEIKGDFFNQSAHTRKVKVVSYIQDADKQTIARVTTSHKARPGQRVPFVNEIKGFSSPRLWSIDCPYLYTVVTRIMDPKESKVLDEVSSSFGFRWFRFEAKRGFFLNGIPLKLIGTNRHQDYPGLGNALPVDIHVQDVEKVKEMGGNFLRIAHYPQDPAVLETCDRLGILTSVEIPIVNTITESEAFADNCEDMLREMILQDYNHPSVVIWAYMNEVLLRPKFTDDSVRQKQYITNITALARRLEKTARQLDPYRYTMIPNHGSFQRYKKAELTDIPMIVGWNLYQGWYGRDISDFAGFLDRHARELPEKPLIVTEYGAGSDPRLRSSNPERFDYSLEYQTIYHQTYLKEILSRDFVAGVNVWNLADFSSESRGDAVPHINNKGLLTYDRKPKDAYFLYQAYLLDRPFIALGSKLWDDRLGIETSKGISTQPVQVFTNMENATLYLNGLSLGEGQATEKIIEWDVPFVDGKNLLEVVALSNGREYKDFHRVDFTLLPNNLMETDIPFTHLKVNLGDPRFFLDDLTGEVWVPSKEYSTGSWGTLNGRPYKMNSLRRQSFGSDQNILGTQRDPLYQTQQVGLEGFRADLPNGMYEITLHFAELATDGSKQVLAYNLDEGDNGSLTQSERIFDVSLNGQVVLESLNLAAIEGRERAVTYKFKVSLTSDEGLFVSMRPIEGDPVLNAIEIRKMY